MQSDRNLDQEIADKKIFVLVDKKIFVLVDKKIFVLVDKKIFVLVDKKIFVLVDNSRCCVYKLSIATCHTKTSIRKHQCKSTVVLHVVGLFACNEI